MARINPSRLPQFVERFEDEIPTSYLMRLAWENGFISLREFRRVTGFPSAWRPTVMDLPAGFGDGADAIILPPRFMIANGAIVRFGGDHVKRSQLCLKGMRFCADCLRSGTDTPQPYVLGAWQWRIIARCPIHGQELMSLDERFHDLESFDQATSGAHSGPGLSLTVDRYLFARLANGATENSFLDKLPAYVAAEFCSLLGHLELSIESRKLTSEVDGGFGNPDLREMGYKIASCGRDDIWSFLSDHVTTASRRIAISHRIYSPFLKWHAANLGNSDYDIAFGLIRDHANEHIPLRPDKPFMGHRIANGVHSLTTASREFDMTPKRTRAAMKAVRGTTGRRFHPRTTIEAQLSLEKSLIPVAKAAAALRCSVRILNSLIDAGLLGIRKAERSGRTTQRYVMEADVAALLRRLEGLAVHSHQDPSSLESLDALSKKFRGRTGKLVRALYEGKFKRLSFGGVVRTLGAVRLEPNEVSWVLFKL